MLAYRREEVRDLNAAGRALMDQAGRLGPQRLVLAGGEFAVGDEVLLRRRSLTAQVNNGSRGRIEAIDPDHEQVTLRLSDDRQVTLDADYLRQPGSQRAAQHGLRLRGHRPHLPGRRHRGDLRLRVARGCIASSSTPPQAATARRCGSISPTPTSTASWPSSTARTPSRRTPSSASSRRPSAATPSTPRSTACTANRRRRCRRQNCTARPTGSSDSPRAPRARAYSASSHTPRSASPTPNTPPPRRRNVAPRSRPSCTVAAGPAATTAASSHRPKRSNATRR